MWVEGKKESPYSKQVVDKSSFLSDSGFIRSGVNVNLYYICESKNPKLLENSRRLCAIFRLEQNLQAKEKSGDSFSFKVIPLIYDTTTAKEARDSVDSLRRL